MSSTSSRNLTTLYSGAGSVVPQGAYGNANVVSLLAVGTDGGNTVANITATGNVTAAYFIGDGSQLTNITASNIVGNIAAAGSNTQIQFNTGNVLDASANLTFDTSTSILKVTGNSVFPTAGIEISANTITGNQNLGDLKITTYGGSSIHLQAGYEVTVGDPNGAYLSNAPIRAVEKEALQLTTTGSGAPGIIIGKYTNAYAPMTGNVDVYSSNVGGYGATGNINLSGNVYVSRDAQGADPVYGKANLIVSDSVSVGQAISAAGNITGLVFFGNAAGLTNIPAGNIVGGYGNANVAANLAAFANNPISTSGNITGNVFTGNGSGLTNVVGTYGNANVAANLAAFANNPISTSGNITAGNVITTTLAGTGNASVNLKITPSGNATSNIVGDGSVEIVGATTVLMVNSGLITSRGNSGGGTGNPLTLGAYNGVAQADAKITINDRGTGGLLGEISLEPSGNTTSGQIPYVKIYGGLVIGNGWAGAGNILAPNSDQTIGNISASGNVTAANFFGNVAGNVLAAGSNTQVQFNTTGNIFGASAGFTFNTSSNALAVTGNVTGANINTAGQVNGALVSSTGNIVATANVTGANLVASAAVTAVGTITGGNLVTAGIVTAVGNVVTTSGYFVGDGSQISNIQFAATAGTVTTNAQPNITSVGILTALSVSGNITAANFIGNVTGNITGNVTNALHANVADLANAVAGANVTGTVANATYATSAGSAATANTVTDAAQANITSVGTLTALTVTGNVTAANFFGNVTGNITGNVTNALHANVADLANAVAGANVTGTVANATYATSAGSAATANTVTDAAQANITSVGTLTALTVTGNVTAANFFGNVTGNITGNTTNALHANVADLANAVAGANVTGTVGLAQYVTQNAQANITSVGTLTSLAVTGAVTAASTSVTGNSTAANVVATGLITSTQQTVAGTANVGTVGNIVIAGRNIATDMILSPDGLTGLANLSRGRIAIGAGNVANSFDYDSLNWRRVLISDTIYHANTTTRGSELAVDLITSLTGNVNNTSWQNRGIVMSHTVAGGSAANTVAGPVNNQARAVNQLTPIVTFLVIGGNSIGAGNTTVGAGCSLKPTILVDNYSTLTQGYGVQSEIALNDTGTSAVWNNYVGFNSTINAGTTPTGNIYAFYHGNANTLLTTGTRITNTARAAPNYYFLRNDDPVAQAQLGSLRSYNEFEYSTATSGTVNIDKTNAQVQMIAPTANVSIGDYQNFMTGISDGTNYDLQSDTVTLIIQQGATPYTVTLPSTANAQIKYSGGSSVVGATANAVTLVSISAIRNRGNTGNVYLTAVSTEFV